jgi:flagellar motor switch protein FliN/FliY
MNNVPETPAASPAPELRPELHNWCEAWKNCLQDVLTQVSGDASSQPAVFEISSQPLPATDSDVWYTVVAAGAAHGEMSLRLPDASGTRLAQKLLGETGPAAEALAAQPITPENKEALEELLRQVSGLASTALASSLDGEVKLSLSASAAPSWFSDAIVCLQTRNEAGVSIAVEIQISPALAAALQPRTQAAPSPQTSAPPPSSTPSALSSSYGRLMDVGLGVKLRFGTRRMILREVLALCPGIVVELENTLHSPVDLLLDGRLIAQGDVVVVDGKYGLRITNVVDSVPPPG